MPHRHTWKSYNCYNVTTAAEECFRILDTIEIMITIIVKMMSVDRLIFKNTPLHTKQSTALNILITIRIMRQFSCLILLSTVPAYDFSGDFQDCENFL